MDSDYKSVLAVIRAGGAVVYPTETLYALGCSALNEAACLKVAQIKGRPESKPLPLIIGNAEQLYLAAADVTGDVRRLAEVFWPGPLSILVPAAKGLAPQVMDSRGMTSVRVTPHPVAEALCLDLGAPLVATSANLSGWPPAERFAEVNQELLAQADAALDSGPEPKGGPPSTVVEPLGDGALLLIREGAVPATALEQAGFALRSV